MNRFLLLFVMFVVAGYASATGMAPALAGDDGPVYGLGDISSLPKGTQVTLGYDATVLYDDFFVTFVK